MNVRKAFGQSVVAASVAAGFALLAATSAPAQVSKDAPVPPVRSGDPLPDAPGQRAEIDVNDRQMMETMARGGLAEVEAGRIAEKNSTNPQVKSFAQTMVKDQARPTRSSKRSPAMRHSSRESPRRAKCIRTASRYSRSSGTRRLITAR